MSTKVFTTHVPLSLAEKVDQFAVRLERSRAWIEREEARRRLTLEGLDDIDAGRLVEHAAIEAWAAGLGADPADPKPR